MGAPTDWHALDVCMRILNSSPVQGEHAMKGLDDDFNLSRASIPMSFPLGLATDQSIGNEQ